MQATQTIPAASAPLQFPKAQPAVQTVTQAELVELIEHENLLSQLKEKVSELESGIKSRLEGGAAVQPGVHIASLKGNLRIRARGVRLERVGSHEAHSHHLTRSPLVRNVPAGHSCAL